MATSPPPLPTANNTRAQQARRRVGDEVDSVKVRIAAFHESVGRARDMSDKATFISKDLEALKVQAVELGEEEVKVDGFTNGALVASVSNVPLRLYFANLYSNAIGLYSEYVFVCFRVFVDTQ